MGEEEMNYCSNCGERVVLEVPQGDDRRRYVCRKCGRIHYRNPRMVAGAIIESAKEILLCRRAIEPQYGKWTIPAGYLENGETVEECARRETYEEAGARLDNMQPYSLLNLSGINQVYFVYRAELRGGQYHAGEESLEVRFFPLEALPWEDLAFKVVRKVLEVYCGDMARDLFHFREIDVEVHKKLHASW